MKNPLTPMPKNVLQPLGVTAATPVMDAAIQKKIYVSAITIFTISNKKINDMMKIVKSIEEPKEQKGQFLSMLEGALGASLLRNSLTGNRVKPKIPGWKVLRAGEGKIRAGQDFWCHLIIWLILKCKINLMVLIQEMIYLK